jgi:membrane protein DedA with SNARE-associated domain
MPITVGSSRIRPVSGAVPDGNLNDATGRVHADVMWERLNAPVPLASLTSLTTRVLEHHGVVAVFVILALDALLPVGGELPMLLSGVVAAGAIGNGATAFGVDLGTGLGAYVTFSAAGTLGYLLGAVVGWQIGHRGGRELLERHGRWLHLGPRRVSSAERWFARWGRAAVFLGRLTPLVRSFVSVTAGVLGSPFASYVVLTVAGSAIWCFALAGAGWAAGSNWDSIHSVFHVLTLAVVAVVVLAAAAVVVRTRRSRP